MCRLVKLRLYAIEAITSAACTFLGVGIFFYTEHRWGWNLFHNFLLAAAQGAVYVLGALAADPLARRLGRRRLVVIVYLIMAAAALCAALLSRPTIIAGILILYIMFAAVSWPALESLVSSDASSAQMSRRLGIYNLVWAGTGAVALALNGLLIERWPAGVFLIPFAMHTLCALLMMGQRAAPPHAHHAPEAEADLLHHRRLALWLSRITLPATYTAIYALAALLPLLPALRDLDPSAKTIIASSWMITRWAVFSVLTFTTAWHSRPAWLLWAAIAMLFAFIGTVVRPSVLLAAPPWLDLISLVFWQGLLGASVGMIYAGSLYFGMVLSRGSTEHGGYHEALIGLGSILGPGIGAAALRLFDGSQTAGITGAGAVVTLSVAACAITALILGRSDE